MRQRMRDDKEIHMTDPTDDPDDPLQQIISAPALTVSLPPIGSADASGAGDGGANPFVQQFVGSFPSLLPGVGVGASAAGASATNRSAPEPPGLLNAAPPDIATPSILGAPVAAPIFSGAAPAFQAGLVTPPGYQPPVGPRSQSLTPAPTPRQPGLLDPTPPIDGVLGGAPPASSRAVSGLLGSMTDAPTIDDLVHNPAVIPYVTPPHTPAWTGAAAPAGWNNPPPPIQPAASASIQPPAPAGLTPSSAPLPTTDTAADGSGGPTTAAPGAAYSLADPSALGRSGQQAPSASRGLAPAPLDTGAAPAGFDRGLIDPGASRFAAAGDDETDRADDPAAPVDAGDLTETASSLSARDKSYLDRYYGPVADYAARYKVSPLLVLGLGLESAFATKGTYTRTGDAFGMTGGSTKHMVHATSPADNVKTWFDTFGQRVYGVGDDLQAFTNALQARDANGNPVPGRHPYNTDRASTWPDMVRRGVREMQRDMPLYAPQAARQAARPS
jgi:hypothetical protein